MMRVVFIGYIILLAHIRVSSQEVLSIDTFRHSLYLGHAMPDELYRFAPDPKMESLKDEVLRKTGQKQNFELICSNVASIVAVLDKDKRYILYSQRYFNREKDPVARTAMLAQEIGHCVQVHTFEPSRLEDEETNADEFMGYALCLTGVPLSEAEKVAVKWLRSLGPDTSERRITILQGFRRAEASLRNAEHAAWFEQNFNEVLQNFPRFPFPAPNWSADADLDIYFKSCKTLGDADQKIRQALDITGFYSRKYFQVPNGFALVTRMEQFNKDGCSKSEAARWKTRPVRDETFSVMGYLASFFTTEPGYFRIFAFLVTDATITSDQKRQLSREEATNWLNEGACRLPELIGTRAFGKNTGVTALIYEFRVPESTRQPVFAQPSELEGIIHLRQARILGSLEK
ncbi:MAG: hypothetical protein ABIQ93_14960 [Saprospiraceae bacterium]